MRGSARTALVLVGIVGIGCFTPTSPLGVPCGPGDTCPTGQLCASATNTCESDGSDGTVDVTGGGVFSVDLSTQEDSLPDTGCGRSGGRDAEFEVTLADPEVYYFDTFASDVATTLRVFDKPCAMVGRDDMPVLCAEDACGGSRSQVAQSLSAGTTCIVVDADGATSGLLSLEVIPGGRDGQLLADGDQTETGNNCGADNLDEPQDRNCDGPGHDGRDVAYFFTTCPGDQRLLDAAICPEPSWDPVLYARRIEDAQSSDQIGCNDDACGAGPRITDVDISGGVFYALYVDAFDAGECGDYSVDTSLR